MIRALMCFALCSCSASLTLQKLQEGLELEHKLQKKHRQMLQEGCLKEQKPNGVIQSHLGQTFPTTLKVDNITGIPPLRGAMCSGIPNQDGCGMLTFENPVREHQCVKEVPKIIHFVWLDNAMSQRYFDNIMRVHTKNPDWQIMVWVNEKGFNASHLLQRQNPDWFSGNFHVKLLQQHTQPWTNWDLYEKEPNVGGRSDLIRLEVAYLYGGIYMDTDTEANHGFDEYGRVFRWPFVTRGNSDYGNLCNCLFGADQYSGLLKFTMDAWRDTHLHHGIPTKPPTGCPMLTAAFMVYNDPQIMMLGSDEMLQPPDKINNAQVSVTYQSFDGSWPYGESSFARKPSEGKLRYELPYDAFFREAVRAASLRN